MPTASINYHSYTFRFLSCVAEAVMVMMDNVCNVVQDLKPVLLMIVVQIAFAGTNILYKLAVNDGMNLRVAVAYRFLFATAFIAPLALIFERKTRTKMTWTILFQSFLCGLFGGALAQNFYLEALALTSATFASAMANLIPGLTFIMAVFFRMEKLNWREGAGKAKIMGTLIGIGGAMVLTFVKGVEIDIGSFHVNLLHPRNGAHASTGGLGKAIWGVLCALLSGIFYALWLIIQAKMSERYPSQYSSTALMSLWGLLVSVVVAFCSERDLNQWKLGWNIRLLTVAYSGVVVSGMMVVVISWCIRMRGPLFASVFSPLMLVMVALAGSTMLNEKLHLGCIVGAVLIVCGLYMVLWGKNKEMKKKNQLVPAQNFPNAGDHTVEIMVRSTVEDKQFVSLNLFHFAFVGGGGDIVKEIRMNTWNLVHALKPALLMVVVQVANAWVNVLYKLAVNDGMSLRIIVAYRYIFATAFIAPLAFIIERKTRTKMTWTILFQAFLCGLIGGALPQNLNMEALALTSVTFTTAISNLIPAITFIISISCGLERLNLRTGAGKAKIIGTICGIGGAMIMTFIKGHEFQILSFHINLFNHRNGHVVHPQPASSAMTVLGALASIASNVSYALWLIIQAKMSERYPCPYSSTALMSLMGALLSITFAFCFDRDLSQWKLGWNVRLLTVAYAGIVVSGVMVAAISWCVRTRGPLFVAIFSPLMLVVVAFAGSTILDEKLYLGSVIGSLLIICGLYVVLWGKSKEMGKNQSVPSERAHKSDAVEVIVKSHGDGGKEDSLENGDQKHVRNIVHYKAREEREGINASRA
ncbi:hypothetical protein RJT34_13368 [Clitoria ternatea]|uniref:EamA domain-containing protein n=1 Tax=Clitoria ternatea TaxID=43366 RepID=A0AAN9PLN2_CLITE